MPFPGRPIGPSPGSWPYRLRGEARSLLPGPLQVRQVAQIPEGVDPRCVATGEADLQRVLPDEAHVCDLELLLVKLGGTVQSPRQTRLASAFRARTGPPQLPARVARPGPVLPGDLQNVVGSNQVDSGRKRVGVSQRTLITGSWRNDWIDVLAAI